MTPDDHDAVLKLVGKIDTLVCRVDNLTQCVEKCQLSSSKTYVTRREFSPVQRLTYGAVAVVLSYVIYHTAVHVFS